MSGAPSSSATARRQPSAGDMRRAHPDREVAGDDDRRRMRMHGSDRIERSGETGLGRRTSHRAALPPARKCGSLTWISTWLCGVMSAEGVRVSGSCGHATQQPRASTSRRQFDLPASGQCPMTRSRMPATTAAAHSAKHPVRTEERDPLLPLGERALPRRLRRLLLGALHLLLGDHRDRIRELGGAHHRGATAAHQQTKTEGVEGDDGRRADQLLRGTPGGTRSSR